MSLLSLDRAARAGHLVKLILAHSSPPWAGHEEMLRRVIPPDTLTKLRQALPSPAPGVSAESMAPTSKELFKISHSLAPELFPSLNHLRKRVLRPLRKRRDIVAISPHRLKLQIGASSGSSGSSGGGGLFRWRLGPEHGLGKLQQFDFRPYLVEK